LGFFGPEPNGGDEISSIIIDGYNCTGIDHGDLGAEREKLIRQLAEYRKIKGHDITVVFDGWKSGGPKEVSMMTGGVRIIYSRLGETADFVIKRILEKGKKEWIVVSSDRDIAAYVWSHGGVAVPTAEFHKVLRKAATSFSGDYESLEEYDGVPDRRGNPRRLSKKEKALLRTLKKLR
jgi:uncharacterized protein